MTNDFVTTLDIALVVGMIGLGIGFFWGRRNERANWNRLIDMKVIPMPPKWVQKWFPGITGTDGWFPQSPPSGTPLWDPTTKHYVHHDQSHFNRNRGLF